MPGNIDGTGWIHLKGFLARVGMHLRTPRHLQCSVVGGNDVRECIELRRSVFGEELHRSDATHDSSPGDADSLDADSLHVACRDMRSGRIVGAIRMTRATFLDAQHHREYGLQHFPAAFRVHVVIVSRLAVLKTHRRGMAGLLLTMKAYEMGLDRLNCLVSVIQCEPGLFIYYRRLGYRPLDRVQVSPFGGYRLPLHLVLHEYEHLERCGSPFLAVARERGFPPVREGIHWRATHEATHGAIDVGYATVSATSIPDFATTLLDGISDRGRREVLAGAVRIRSEAGDRVLRKGEGSNGIGFVLSGTLEVRDGDRLLRILGAGDLFGELAYVLGVPRTADVIAATPGTEILLVRLKMLEKLSRPSDRAQLWRNLARVLASRLASAH